MSVLIPTTPAEEAAVLALQAVSAVRGTVDTVIEEMVAQPRHVLLFQEGQDALAHLALEGVTKNIADSITTSHSTLDNLVVLDSTVAEWQQVSPLLEVMDGETLRPGYLHRSHLIFAFGAEFLEHSVVLQLAHTATRFYAAIQDGPGVTNLIESVHPMEEVVLL